jgi:hypothetical protein
MPEKVVKILAKHGAQITENEAAKVLEFFQLLADLTLDHYKEIMTKRWIEIRNEKRRVLTFLFSFPLGGDLETQEPFCSLAEV